MPHKALKPCPWPGGCAELTDGRYCGVHRKAETRRRGSSTDQGYGAQWRHLRTLVLREEPWCRRCSDEGKLVRSTQVDHIKPRAQGGTDTRSNLQGLCASHHSEKTMRQSVNPVSGNGYT